MKNSTLKKIYEAANNIKFSSHSDLIQGFHIPSDAIAVIYSNVADSSNKAIEKAIGFDGCMYAEEVYTDRAHGAKNGIFLIFESLETAKTAAGNFPAAPFKTYAADYFENLRKKVESDGWAFVGNCYYKPKF